MATKIFRYLFISCFLFCDLPMYSEEMQILRWTPRLFYFENFLNDEECDYLIAKAQPALAPSYMVDAHSEERLYDPYRSSESMFFSPYLQDPVINSIENRISALTFFPKENGETLQVVHYIKGGEYKAHHDFFNPDTIGGQAHLQRSGQRLATFLMYLSAPQQGGETIFPLADVVIQPKKGAAILFFNCLPSGEEDEMTLHLGAPVIEGEKWIATKWFHPFQYH